MNIPWLNTYPHRNFQSSVSFIKILPTQALFKPINPVKVAECDNGMRARRIKKKKEREYCSRNNRAVLFREYLTIQGHYSCSGWTGALEIKKNNNNFLSILSIWNRCWVRLKWSPHESPDKKPQSPLNPDARTEFNATCDKSWQRSSLTQRKHWHNVIKMLQFLHIHCYKPSDAG